MPAGGVADSEEHGTTLYGLSRSCSRSFQMGTFFKEFNGTSGSNKNPFAGTCAVHVPPVPHCAFVVQARPAVAPPIHTLPVVEPFVIVPPGAAMAGGGVSVKTRARA